MYFSIERFCTVILTVSAEDQRVEPVLLFKGKGRVSAAEEQQYAKGVKVYFTPKAVNNKVTMDKYNEWFTKKVNLLLSWSSIRITNEIF